jgi:hypothetical protein
MTIAVNNGIRAKTWIRNESPENDPALKRRVDIALTSEMEKK